MLIKKFFPRHRNTGGALSIDEFYQKRNRVLLIRNARGLGDIFMCRMLFQDFKKVMPEMHLVFACPKPYHDAVKDHPFVDEVIDSTSLNRNNYLISYDISTCCIKWECKHAPNANKHRADIWAEHCGVKLENHDMHLKPLSEEMMRFGKMQVQRIREMSPRLYDPKTPNVLFTPIAFDKLRTFTDEQIVGVVNHLRDRGVFVYSTHHTPVPILENLGVPVLHGFGTMQWMSFIQAADYVVTTDTSVFHYAGGIKKPLTGVFTHADGKYRGQYFDFILVQKHRDDGNWTCGPCYNHAMCTHPKCKNPGAMNEQKPCLTELTVKDVVVGISKMFDKWAR